MYKTDIMNNRYKSLSKELADCTKKWIRVGEVRSMSIYPIFAGKAIDSSLCRFDLSGPSVIKNNCEMQNNMFVIYNQKTKRAYREQYDPAIHTLEMLPVSKHLVLLTTTRMHSVLLLDLMKIQKSFHIVPYFELLNHKYLIDLRCLDCGEEAAEWITKCLDKPDLRLGFNKPGSTTAELFWNQFGQLYSLSGRDRESMICYAELPSCSLISGKSYTIINEKIPHFMHMQQFLPNVVVTPVNSPSFFEIEWEWIKIGDAIVKNINPWWRYSDVEPNNLPTDLLMHLMTLICNVYHPGEAHINSTVYIRINDESD